MAWGTYLFKSRWWVSLPCISVWFGVIQWHWAFGKENTRAWKQKLALFWASMLLFSFNCNMSILSFSVKEGLPIEEGQKYHFHYSFAQYIISIYSKKLQMNLVVLSTKSVLLIVFSIITFIQINMLIILTENGNGFTYQGPWHRCSQCGCFWMCSCTPHYASR